MTIDHPATRTILDWFEKINAIPRGSRNERAISDWLMAWAAERGFEARRDDALNVVVVVPGSAGRESAETVVLQGHMDMVCEKTKDSSHDFAKDAIQLVYGDDGWLRADGTTLGADNGIAIAMALTAATDAELPHPPLELLFTVDEETGLTGANALEPGFIRGKVLLNLDSEDEGVFTVGCAGGRDTHLSLPIEREAAPDGYAAFKVVVGGLRGGHSGVDIHEQRGNAIRELARALLAVLDVCDARLVSIDGGSAHNAIPRDAEAVVFLPTNAAARVGARLSQLDAALKSELKNIDPDVAVTIASEAGVDGAGAWSAACSARAVRLVAAIPHGIDAMSIDIDGLVETSDNLATVRTTDDGTLDVLTSQRSSVMERLDFLTHRIEAVSRLAGADAVSEGGYPAWEPNMDSALLERCKRTFRERFGKDPVVEVIHAGLECGIIGDKNPGMDMISFGPTIQNPHSPDEQIEVATIGLVWDFLAALLASYE